MPKVLSLVNPDFDTWITQAEFFRPSRRLVNLSRISQLFVDFDTYNEPWSKGRTPNQLVECLLFFCEDAGVPPPSIMIFSGRGIQAKWFLTSGLPRRALPRWNACQSNLVNRLIHAGADRNAKDASRVLRLIDTVNTKSGEKCKVVYVNEEYGQPKRYNFEYMAETLLPVGRWVIETQREQKREKAQLKLLDGGKKDKRKGFSGRELAWHRMEDLRTLASLRGGVKQGEKTTHLFWRLNFLLLSGATNSSTMYAEAAELSKEIDPSWNHRSKELMTLYSKAKEYEAGGKVEFNGRQLTPLYTPKNQTLIDLFGITDDEQRQLKTIISKDMALERHRTREKARRRAAGAIDRETYENQSISRQKPWEALGISRRTWYRREKK